MVLTLRPLNQDKARNMNKLFITLAVLLCSGTCFGQTEKDAYTIYYAENYSRWSFGLATGLAGLNGDVSSWSDPDKQTSFSIPIWHSMPIIGLPILSAYGAGWAC